MSLSRPARLLIVEDDRNLADMLKTYLGLHGYDVLIAMDGFSALSMAHASPPDLIILDIRLPDLDGFQVHQRLEHSHVTRGIPLVILTELRERNDRLAGLAHGAQAYITKPFDLYEFGLRIRNILERDAAGALRNAVTGLPEGPAVVEALTQLLIPGISGLLIARINGLAEFRDRYGFVAADNVLGVVASTLSAAAYELGGSESLCGHIDEDLFLICVPVLALDELQARVRKRLDQALHYFYPPEDAGQQRLALTLLPLAEVSYRMFDLEGIIEQAQMH